MSGTVPAPPYPYRPPEIDEQTMTSLSRAGIAGTLAAVAAAILYLAVLAGEPGKPAESNASVAGQARAEALFAGLKNSERFKASGGSVSWESAAALGDEGLLVRKLSIEGNDRNGRPTKVAADEVRVRRIDWKNIGMSPYGDVEIRGLTATNGKIAAFAAVAGVTAFVADLKARWDYRSDIRIADLQILDIAIREWGTLSAQTMLHGLDFSALQELQKGGEIDPAYVAGLMAGTKIASLEIAFSDRGAIDKLAAMRAGETGQDKNRIIDLAVEGLAAQKADQPYEIVRQAFDALTVFVKKRGTIALKAAPKTPVPLLRLVLTGRADPAGIERLARELGLSVEAR